MGLGVRNPERQLNKDNDNLEKVFTGGQNKQYIPRKSNPAFVNEDVNDLFKSSNRKKKNKTGRKMTKKEEMLMLKKKLFAQDYQDSRA